MARFASLSDIRKYLPQVAEDGVQLITISGAQPGDTFALGYEGASTPAVAYNATATAVQAALRAIPDIGSGGGVKVTGRPGGPYRAEFQGTLATDAGPITADASDLTPPATITIAPASDTVLQQALDRASDIVRSAMRSLLADPTFDFAAYDVASTRIVRGVATNVLRLPPHQAGSVTLIEYQSGYAPSAYTELDSAWWEAQADGTIWRVGGWGGYAGSWGWGDPWLGIGDSAIDIGFGLRTAGDYPRYRVTAIWGYGPTPPDAIVQLTLELAVNIWRSRDKGGFSESVGVEGAGAIRQVAGLNKQQQAILENLRDQWYEVAF